MQNRQTTQRTDAPPMERFGNGERAEPACGEPRLGLGRREGAAVDSQADDRLQALSLLQQGMALVAGDVYGATTTFADVSQDWLAQLEQLVAVGRRSPSTVYLYRHALHRHVLPAVGPLWLTDLTPARLDHFLRLKQRTTGRATAKLCRAILSGVCGLAVRREGLTANPVRDVSSLEVCADRQARALTVEEVHEWLAILDGSDFARRRDLPDLARFLLGTGCRLGEAVGVHWEDVDLDCHTVHVCRTVLRVPGQGVVVKRPKSRSGWRLLRIPVWLVDLLRQRSDGASPGDPVFPDGVGGYRDRNNIEKDFRRVRSGTPFEWVVPHTYRKTVATLLDASGLSARTIADQLGHARISMTQDVYLGRKAVDTTAAAALDTLMPAPDNRDGQGLDSDY